MIRCLSNIGILCVYLLFFGLIVKPLRKASVMLFLYGFTAASFSVLPVDLLYRIYLNARSFAAIIEETSKFAFVLLFFSCRKLNDTTFKNKNLVWLGALVGLFFAFLENFSYISTFNIDLSVVIKRCFTAWPMHILYTSCSSYGLMQTFIRKKGVIWLLLLPLSIIIHHLYNTFIAPIIP